MVCKAGLTFDDVLCQYVGQFGAGQRKVAGMVSTFWLANAFVFFCWVFCSIDPVYSRAWECRSLDDAACMAIWSTTSHHQQQQDFCASLSPTQWRWTSEASVVARFGLVCGNAWKVQFINTMMFIGCFLGAGLFGTLCDTLGRRRPLFISTAIIAAAMAASAAAPNYWFLAAARLIAGVGAAGQSQCIVLLCTEMTGPSFRGLANTASLCIITLGEFLLVALASAAPHWRTITTAAAALNAAGLLLFPFPSLIPESARWLLSKGRKDDAYAVLRGLSASNGWLLPPVSAVPLLSQSCSSNSRSGSMDSISSGLHTPAACRAPVTEGAGSKHAPCGASNDELAVARQHVAAGTAGVPKQHQEQLTLLQLLRCPPLLLRWLVLLLTWFALYVTAYGVVLGSGALPGSIYMTFTMMAAAELSAMLVAAALVDRIGRQNVITVGLVLGGCCCLGCAAAPDRTAQAVLAVLGKFGCSFSLAVVGTYTSELFPTAVRASAMGLFNQSARIGSIAAPCMLMLGTLLAPHVSNVSNSGSNSTGALFIPYLAFGAVSLLAGSGVLLLMPETLGADMPESIEDLLQLQSVLSAQPWHDGCWALLSFLVRTHSTSAGVKLPQQPQQHTADTMQDLCEAGLLGSITGSSLSTATAAAAAAAVASSQLLVAGAGVSFQASTAVEASKKNMNNDTVHKGSAAYNSSVNMPAAASDTTTAGDNSNKPAVNMGAVAAAAAAAVVGGADEPASADSGVTAAATTGSAASVATSGSARDSDSSCSLFMPAAAAAAGTMGKDYGSDDGADC